MSEKFGSVEPMTNETRAGIELVQAMLERLLASPKDDAGNGGQS